MDYLTKLKAHELWVKTKGREGFRADLTNAYMRGADLTNADLTNAYMRGAILANADLTNAYMRGAILANADLTNADLTNAKLTEADLTNAKLTEADLTGANLNGTDVFYFQMFKWPCFYHSGTQYEDGDYLKIGCLGYSLSYWLRYFERIGKAHGFTKEQIRQHYQIGMFINNYLK